MLEMWYMSILNFYYFKLCVLYVYVWEYWCLKGPEEGFRFHRAGSTAVERPRWKTMRTVSPQDQHVLSIGEPALQHLNCFRHWFLCKSVNKLKKKMSFYNFLSLTLIRYLVISLPAISSLLVRWGREKPSYTGQIWVTPSPESTTTPVNKPAQEPEGLESRFRKIKARKISNVAKMPPKENQATSETWSQYSFPFFFVLFFQDRISLCSSAYQRTM